MPYSVELFFDPVTAAGVRSAWSVLGDITGSPYMVNNGVIPHVALAVFEADAFPPVLPALLGKLASELRAQSLTRMEIRCFHGQTPVVFMGFAVCPFLRQVHKEVQALLNQLGLTNDAYYGEERWVPHCTLAMEFPTARLARTMEAAKGQMLNVPCEVTQLGLIRYPPTQVLWQSRLGLPEVGMRHDIGPGR